MIVGDNPIKDIEGGNALGLTTALLSKDKKRKIVYSEDDDYKMPNYIIDKVSDVLKILKIN